MRKTMPSKISSRAAGISLLLAVIGIGPYLVSQAQSSDGSITVAGVSTHASANGTVVSIAANGPLSKAQTWQDSEGYHVVVPSADAQNQLKVSRGVKVRQLDHSLEILVQTKPGASVTVQPSGNRLNLLVDGNLDQNSSSDADKSRNGRAESASEKTDKAGEKGNSRSASSEEDESTGRTAKSPDEQASDSRVSQQASADQAPASTGQATSSSQNPQPASTPQQQRPQAAQGSVLASIFSGTTVLIVVGVGGLALFVLRRRAANQAAGPVNEMGGEEFEDYVDDVDHEATNALARRDPQRGPSSTSGTAGSNGSSSQRKSLARMPVAAAAIVYGAYQVDQEVAKLVQGQPHKIDVVGSRAPDDRRAIEASLMKALTSPNADEDSRRRAREALEEYGFVARQSASLLQAADPYERTSAARMLGEVKCPASLPFLLEALYDHESIVRNQAVLSIGLLKLPSAIGALLDIARKHPDVPGSLLSNALNACSVEGLDFFDSPIPAPALLSAVDVEQSDHDFSKLEPACLVQELPEFSDDEKFSDALAKVESEDKNERREAIKALAQFPVRNSVEALARVARADSASNLRALAISGLASINHESVFPAVLIGMADESREVRAAAARSLSRLNVERSDAYVRVMEANDTEMMREVAEACIKAGIASQAIDRLSSSDRRYAYEALSLVSLLVKANVLAPLLDAIANHPQVDVRLSVLRFLAQMDQPSVLEGLRQLPTEGMPEEVKSALDETTSMIEAILSVDIEQVGEIEPDHDNEVLAFSLEADQETLSPANEVEYSPEADQETLPPANEVEYSLEADQETSPSANEVEHSPEADHESPPSPNEVEASGLSGPAIA
jgi:HEAT repeat protein